jgi:hypothetical protein
MFTDGRRLFGREIGGIRLVKSFGVVALLGRAAFLCI